MKAENKINEVPVIITLTQREAKALTAIIGCMGKAELDKIEKETSKPELVVALKAEREERSNVMYHWYNELMELFEN